MSQVTKMLNIIDQGILDKKDRELVKKYLTKLHAKAIELNTANKAMADVDSPAEQAKMHKMSHDQLKNFCVRLRRLNLELRRELDL